MRSVIADTGPLYAAYAPSDRYHAQALAEIERLAQQNLTILIPYPIFLETHSLILNCHKSLVTSRFIEVRSQFAILSK
jgi:uncharacterized protein